MVKNKMGEVARDIGIILLVISLLLLLGLSILLVERKQFFERQAALQEAIDEASGGAG